MIEFRGDSITIQMLGISGTRTDLIYIIQSSSHLLLLDDKIIHVCFTVRDF